MLRIVDNLISVHHWDHSMLVKKDVTYIDISMVIIEEIPPEVFMCTCA